MAPPCRRDAFTMNMLEIPQGAGSGFIWDEAGAAGHDNHRLQKGCLYIHELDI